MSLPIVPDVDFYTEFFSAKESEMYMERLINEIDFAAETYTFNGQTIVSKRKVSYHSELAYSYSNQSYSGKPWTPTLLEIKEKVEAFTGYEFNAVLVNSYEDGEAGMGWHADKEKELGKEPVIGSISLGETRVFAFRHRKDVVNMKNPPRLCDYALTTGSLLIMKGKTQDLFEHSVIKNKSATKRRLNLTFRKVVENN